MRGDNRLWGLGSTLLFADADALLPFAASPSIHDLLFSPLHVKRAIMRLRLKPYRQRRQSFFSLSLLMHAIFLFVFSGTDWVVYVALLSFLPDSLLAVEDRLSAPHRPVLLALDCWLLPLLSLLPLLRHCLLLVLQASLICRLCGYYCGRFFVLPFISLFFCLPSS